MAYIIDKTRFRHSTYGIGTFRGYSSPGIMSLDFPGHGASEPDIWHWLLRHLNHSPSRSRFPSLYRSRR